MQLLLTLINLTVILIPIQRGLGQDAASRDTTIDVIPRTGVIATRELTGTNYFSATKERSTMNIAKVNGEDIRHQPVTSLMNAVTGRMTGVNISSYKGRPHDERPAISHTRRRVRAQSVFGQTERRLLNTLDHCSYPPYNIALARIGLKRPRCGHPFLFD
jgi:hypothetical protein